MNERCDGELFLVSVEFTMVARVADRLTLSFGNERADRRALEVVFDHLPCLWRDNCFAWVGERLGNCNLLHEKGRPMDQCHE